jgi:hypothetical protein
VKTPPLKNWRQKMRMKEVSIFLMVLFLSLIFCFGLYGQGSTKGTVFKVKENGKSIILYEGSYALLIGIWDYKNGWDKFERENIENDMVMVEKALQNHDFKIKRLMNPTYKEIDEELTKFKNEYGFEKNNRLLFYFSGHGMSRHNNTIGYIVPMDAPYPKTSGSEKEFLKKAISMERLKALAKEIDSKHVLFVFDSCFSGTILKPRLGNIPGNIKMNAAKPVRRFITAGKANQPVPEKSKFTPAFVRGIKGKADLYKDGYITGSELCEYIKSEVEKFDIGQNPQCGTIKVHDNEYEGDFVFILPSTQSLMIGYTSSNTEIEINNIIDECFDSLGCEVTVSIGTFLVVSGNFEYSNSKKYWLAFIDDDRIWPLVEISEQGFRKSAAVPKTDFNGGELVLICVQDDTHHLFNNWLSHNPLFRRAGEILLKTKINIK